MRSLPLFLIAFICIFAGSIYGQSKFDSVTGILIDNTGSMRTQLFWEQSLAKTVVGRIKKESAISLFGFATDSAQPYQRASWAKMIQCSPDRDAVVSHVAKVTTAAGQTKLYDAIRFSAESLRKSPGCENSEATLILISDGEDRASEIRQDELFKLLTETKVKVLVIGLIDELLDEPGFTARSPAKKSKDFLKKLTSLTGGKVVFATKKMTAEEVVTELF
jgi:hypothetical protein